MALKEVWEMIAWWLKFYSCNLKCKGLLAIIRMWSQQDRKWWNFMWYVIVLKRRLSLFFTWCTRWTHCWSTFLAYLALKSLITNYMKKVVSRSPARYHVLILKKSQCTSKKWHWWWWIKNSLKNNAAECLKRMFFLQWNNYAAPIIQTRKMSEKEE